METSKIYRKYHGKTYDTGIQARIIKQLTRQFSTQLNDTYIKFNIFIFNLFDAKFLNYNRHFHSYCNNINITITFYSNLQLINS